MSSNKGGPRNRSDLLELGGEMQVNPDTRCPPAGQAEPPTLELSALGKRQEGPQGSACRPQHSSTATSLLPLRAPPPPPDAGTSDDPPELQSRLTEPPETFWRF